MYQDSIQRHVRCQGYSRMTEVSPNLFQMYNPQPVVRSATTVMTAPWPFSIFQSFSAPLGRSIKV